MLWRELAPFPPSDARSDVQVEELGSFGALPGYPSGLPAKDQTYLATPGRPGTNGPKGASGADGADVLLAGTGALNGARALQEEVS